MKSSHVRKADRCDRIAVCHQECGPPVGPDGAADKALALGASERVPVPSVVDRELERFAQVLANHRVGSGGPNGHEPGGECNTDPFNDRHARPARLALG